MYVFLQSLNVLPFHNTVHLGLSFWELLVLGIVLRN